MEACADPSMMPEGIRLRECPCCEYSLEGLPANYRCPECGFLFDEQTFILSLIPRGASNMPTGRKVLWALGALFLWLLTSFAQFAFLGNSGGFLMLMLLLCAGIFGYLYSTGKRGRKGVEPAVFTPEGFAYVCNMNPADAGRSATTPWSMLRSVRLEPKGSMFYRLRLAGFNGPGGALSKPQLDAGVRCYPETAQWIEATLQERLHASDATYDRT